MSKCSGSAACNLRAAKVKVVVYIRLAWVFWYVTQYEA